MTYDEFWNNYLPTTAGKIGPGLLDFGIGLYNKNAAQRDAASRLAAARGPLYDQYTGAAGTTLTQAGDFNPDAFAKQRFDAQQKLLQPYYDKQLGDVQSMLRARGQLGISNYQGAGVDPATGTMQVWQPTPGVAMNPQLAAFFAAQNGQRAKDAYNSLGAGQDYLNNLVNRAGMLQTGANNTQATGLAGQRTQPSSAAANAELLKGAAGVLKNSGVIGDVFKGVPGMIGGGIDWLKNFFNPSPAEPLMNAQNDFGSMDFLDFGGNGSPDFGDLAFDY